MSDALLHVQDLNVDLPGLSGPVRILDHVSFTVDAGRTTGLIGEMALPARRSFFGAFGQGIVFDAAALDVHVVRVGQLRQAEQLGEVRVVWVKVHARGRGERPDPANVDLDAPFDDAGHEAVEDRDDEEGQAHGAAQGRGRPAPRGTGRALPGRRPGLRATRCRRTR